MKSGTERSGTCFILTFYSLQKRETLPDQSDCAEATARYLGARASYDTISQTISEVYQNVTQMIY